MKYLDEGDVILFMSICDAAVVDTVFVVKERVILDENKSDNLYEAGKIIYQNEIERLRKRVALQYLNGVILPICYGNKGSLSHDGSEEQEPVQNVLYIGATYDAPVYVNGNPMYSFFPCKPIREQDRNDLQNYKGFCRYPLKSPNGNAPTKQAQTPRYKGILPGDHFTPEAVYHYWNALKNDVLAKGYCLGVKAYEPEFSD